MSSGTRIGFIGVSAGSCWAAASHIPYLKSDANVPGYTITALQNTSKASGEKAAEAHGLGKIECYDKPEDIAKTDVDIIAVSVKVPGHYAAIKPALQAGKNVFVEWPLARNLKEAEELTSLAKSKGARTLVGLQGRQSPSVLALKKIVDSGDLGTILSTTMHGYGAIMGAVMPTSYEYIADIENGANLLTIPMGHAVDALCYALGEWDYVSANLANRRPVMQYKDPDHEGKKTAHDVLVVSGTLQKSGALVNVIYEGGENPSGQSGFVWQINGTGGCVLLEGKQGHLQMHNPTVKFGKTGEQMKEVEVPNLKAGFDYPIGRAWNAFAGHGDGHVTSFEDALLRHKMIDAIYRSNESGQRERYL